MDTEKQSSPHGFVKLLIWILPTLVLLLAALFVFKLVPTLFSALTFAAIVLIGLIISRLLMLLISKKTGVQKAWRIAVWVAALLLLLFISLFLPRATHERTEINAQSRFENAAARYLDESFIPLELGTTRSVEYHNVNTIAAIFESSSYTLLCTYDEEEYAAEKAALEARYSFRTKDLPTEFVISGEEVKRIPPYTDIGNYNFRFVLPRDEYPDDCFFKSCFIIVTNDESHEIGYIVFYDYDLDEADDLTRFLIDYCGWNYIR
ncbi:MAG: hypothetical protein J5772_00250 [Clostridia bacterium]|nr:hypothetical protein [Clostridia bacterium]